MGQSTSKEGDRLAELAWMIAHAHSSMLKMQPLAAAEEAANEPPTPDSSQAAYHASRQRYLILTHERHLINRRVGEHLEPSMACTLLRACPRRLLQL